MRPGVSLVAAAFAVLGAGAAHAQQSFPLTVEHALGTTTIPAAPRRVVALNQRDGETLLALGIQPVAVYSTLGFEKGVGPWAEPLIEGADPIVWNWDELNYEAIVAAAPDLIVYATSGGDADEYARLSQIAPTVALPKGAKPWDATLEQVTQLTAEAVGRKAEGDKLLADLAAKIDGIKAGHPEFAGRTINYLNTYDTDIYAYDETLSAHRLFYSLGFAPAPSAIDLPGTDSWFSISAELLGDFDADVLVMFTYGRPLEQVVRDIPSLVRLPAVEQGRTIALADGALNMNSIVSLPYALDILVPQLSDAVGRLD